LTLRILFTRKPNHFRLMMRKREGYLSGHSFAAIYKAAEEQGRMLSGLRRTLAGN
jgi:hypothetical protein